MNPSERSTLRRSAVSELHSDAAAGGSERAEEAQRPQGAEHSQGAERAEPTEQPARARLSLVPPRPSSPQRYSPLALWHLLSLDAPTVAALWTWTVAHTVGIVLPWTASAAMALAVWMLYASDRLLDARPLPGGEAPRDLEERHRFHQRHRSVFLAAIVAVAAVLAGLLHTLDPRALHLYAALATMLAAWLLLVHAPSPAAASAQRLPKELAVGIFFPAAVFIPTVARAPELRLPLLAPAAIFAALCTLNCLYLYAWEHPASLRTAHWTTRWAVRRLVPLTLTVAALSALLVVAALPAALPLASRLAPHGAGSFLLPALCTLVSTLLLLALHKLRDRLSALHLRALADLVLLSPLLVVPLASLASR
ncbi:MAG TPA: hypothetical protein VM865_01500 [Acidobacteriaceae bacterium]|jgi:hypothetical protein|nr:hypothetical protein [Acidobacteriaceae bacterium]